MNPVARRLLDRVADPDLAEMALAWDAFEEQIVSIYRAGSSLKQDEDVLKRRRRRAAQAYERWAEALEPPWRAATIDGRAVLEDPFLTFLGVSGAAGVLGNRDLLRALPPAREAVNRLLMERRAKW